MMQPAVPPNCSDEQTRSSRYQNQTVGLTPRDDYVNLLDMVGKLGVQTHRGQWT